MKKELMYFPHLHDARNDRKVRRMRNELGIEGYGIFFMLLEKLRSEDGMCYPLEDVDLLAKEFETTEQKVLATIKGYRLFEFDDRGNFYSPKLFDYMQPMFKRREKAQKAARKRWGQSNNNELNPGPDDKKALPEASNTDIEQYSSNAQALPKQCSVNAVQCKEKKRKENESKVNKSKLNKTPPVQNSKLTKPLEADFSDAGCSVQGGIYYLCVEDLPVSDDGIPESVEEVMAYCREHGIKRSVGKNFYGYFKKRGWKMKTGQPVTKWQAKFKGWLKHEKNEWRAGMEEAEPKQTVRASMQAIDLTPVEMTAEEFRAQLKGEI